MPHLIDLPNELLILIFQAGRSVHPAIQLAATCRPLRHLWLENCDDIVKKILATEIDDFSDAVALAKAEARYLPPTATDPEDPPPQLWLPRLLKNAEFASDITRTYWMWRHEVSARRRVEKYWRGFEDLTSIPASFYLLLNFKLAYVVPHLRAGLLEQLEHAPMNVLVTHLALVNYIWVNLDKADQDRYGMIKDIAIRILWEEQDLNLDEGWKWAHEDWEYATEVLQEACLRAHEVRRQKER